MVLVNVSLMVTKFCSVNVFSWYIMLVLAGRDVVTKLVEPVNVSVDATVSSGNVRVDTMVLAGRPFALTSGGAVALGTDTTFIVVPTDATRDGINSAA